MEGTLHPQGNIDVNDFMGGVYFIHFENIGTKRFIKK